MPYALFYFSTGESQAVRGKTAVNPRSILDQMARAFNYLTNDEPDPLDDLQNLSRLEWGQLMGMLKTIMAERKGAPLH